MKKEGKKGRRESRKNKRAIWSALNYQRKAEESPLDFLESQG
jgi:hypothetical protein